MVKEAIYRFYYPIKLYGNLLLVFQNVQHASGNLKLSATIPWLEPPGQFPLRKYEWRHLIFAMLVALFATSVTTCATVEKTKNNEIEDKHTPIFFNRPVLSPSGIAPGKIAQVVTGISVKGSSSPPPVIYLDEVTNQGEFISIQAELRDDGKKPDKKAGDQFYTTPRFELGGPGETELYFRFRAEHGGKTVISRITVFPITSLPLDARRSNLKTLVDSADGQDKLFSNEVIIGTHAGISPRRVREIVVKVGEKLGLIPDNNKIAGYLPRPNIYLVEFRKGKGTPEEVNRVISEFRASDYESDIRYASPNFWGNPAGIQWFHEHIGVDKLRPRLYPPPTPTPPGQLPLYGSDSIGVAILESLGVDCANLSPDKCEPNPFDSVMESNCFGNYGKEEILNGADPGHGRKVATLIADRTGYDDVQEGVALDTKLYPFRVNNTYSFQNAVDCVQAVKAKGHPIQIINYSRAGNGTPTLKNAVCDAICDNILVVAAADNTACLDNPVDDDGKTINGYPVNGQNINRYPAAYDLNEPGQLPDGTVAHIPVTDCTCGTNPNPGTGILRVGGTTNNLQRSRGDSCSNDNKKSKPGAIYAPGWGIPNADTTNPSLSGNGTSWSTALVSGCAAILVAVQEWRTPGSWSATNAKSKISSSVFDPMAAAPLLNCLAAVSDPYDIAFVLDRSGSMNALTISGVTRWTALTDAVNGITPMISATAPPDSQYGLTSFAHFVDPMAQLTLIDDSLEPTVQGVLQGINPGGATAMGLGLKDALSVLENSTRKKVVVLFTDGMQNWPPLVDSGGCQMTDSTIIPGFLCAGVTDGFVKIVAVGIDNPSVPYITTLQGLVDKSGGSLFITDGTTFSDTVGCTDSLNSAFDCAIAPALYGTSPQMVTAYQGTLSNIVNLTPFHLNQVSQLLIKISFSQNLSESEFSAILKDIHIMKGPENITRYFERVTTAFPTHSVLLKTDFVHQNGGETSTISSEGSYRIKMSEKNSPSPALTYRVVPYADDHRLNMSWRINPFEPRTHQPFNPTVNLSWRGKPLTHASVKAYILQPGDDIGDLMAKHPAKVDPVQAPDAGSPGYQKYLHLKAKDPNFRAKLRPSEKLLPLKHQGNGQYSASYYPGNIAGVYQVVYEVNAEIQGISKVQRTAGQSVYVGFGDIDFENSSARATAKGNSVVIIFRPRRIDGKFIGPAHGNGFRVEGVGIRLKNITEDQMGGYTLLLDGNPNSKIIIKFLGKAIYQGIANIPPDNRNPFVRFFDWLKSLFWSR